MTATKREPQQEFNTYWTEWDVPHETHGIVTIGHVHIEFKRDGLDAWQKTFLSKWCYVTFKEIKNLTLKELIRFAQAKMQNTIVDLVEVYSQIYDTGKMPLDPSGEKLLELTKVRLDMSRPPDWSLNAEQSLETLGFKWKEFNAGILVPTKQVIEVGKRVIH